MLLMLQNILFNPLELIVLFLNKSWNIWGVFIILSFVMEEILMTHSHSLNCDVEYDTNLDDMKSRSGYMLFFNNGPMTWESHKQTCIVNSSTKVEYIVSFVATK